MDQLQPAGMGSVPEESRGQFILATYKYLGIAIAAFLTLSAILYMSGFGNAVLSILMKSRFMWLGVLGGFMIVGWIASYMADNSESNQTQMAGLALYVLAEGIIFSPLIALAAKISPAILPAALFCTALLVGGLTWTAFTSKKDFSFLGGMLKIGCIVALGAIVVSVVMGFSLGIWFSALMVIFAGGCVLYDTSNIIHHYPSDRPAGAALHLFSSIALMLWYVMRILISLASSD